MILTSAVFDWSTRVTDRQTDRRTGDSICNLYVAYVPLRIKISKEDYYYYNLKDCEQRLPEGVEVASRLVDESVEVELAAEELHA